ncbi:MAG: prepilin-type N-terminal cleavage/methylation domain-containing protein [Phycisphaerales bacterium]|jgi:prepilin-type N-terminal cleavage/methylation domain-containing protein|nr:prepilin-type N-terminal cleavage/methylation domain-containing protein [Phycisphaerales bacterium]
MYEKHATFRNGFTLIELLVVIAIISLLISIASVGVNKVLKASRQSSEMAAMREVLHAYTIAAMDRNGKLIEGYPSAETLGKVRGPDGELLPAGMPHSKRYVWRLLPYLDDAIHALYVNDQAPVLSRLIGTECYAYVASAFPSFGLNEVWMGGHKDTTLHPNPAMQSIFKGKFARSLSDVRNPSLQLVFASAQAPVDSDYGLDCLAGEHGEKMQGFWKIQSPRGPTGWQWNTEGTQGCPLPSLDSQDHGWISTRHGDKAITGQLDGSVERLTLAELCDMRRWSIGAKTHDWAPSP